MPNKGKVKTSSKSEKEDLPGYPVYPESEDIYSQATEETEIDPEFPNLKKVAVDDPNARIMKGYDDDESGSDLDIPGAELDDAQEDIGSEDEENNFYSLGGDKEV